MTLEERLMAYEGSIAYQTKLKYFHNGKFYPYKDSLGYWTIGFGRLIEGKQSQFTNGISVEEANKFLSDDIAIAEKGLASLNLGLIPSDWKDFLIIMIFQLGLQGVKNFKKMLIAIKAKDYPEAVRQAKDSKWYRQTPNRVNDMISQLTNR
ncbi:MULTISPECIES: glycoside hydrolase family protein [Klebsiella pneumoniae complex]|uniref:glycoside hydrolase family protein n=1 Tax=Klebsiella pneumoniae complex TaxID=3390273 RepID=UPI002874334D|nr:glycoside hydrolase family protein [Klebsiella variicola]MDS0532489.1 glycoside hydrolase family protein [Klebsiella quasipneumoniae]HBV7913894.1 glycoside hydrolase family protein [Klebsiella variicola]HCM5243682.1 glycoside hydrolase family protein [Klebsiella variicola subsp. variicola]